MKVYYTNASVAAISKQRKHIKIGSSNRGGDYFTSGGAFSIFLGPGKYWIGSCSFWEIHPAMANIA
jgi:hypothetical protein